MLIFHSPLFIFYNFSSGKSSSLYMYLCSLTKYADVIKDIIFRLKFPNTHLCKSSRSYPSFHTLYVIWHGNIRLDSPIVDENFVSEKQCMPPFTSDFYTSTSNCIYATAKITLSQPPAIDR